MSEICKHVFVSGTVQGVGYRAFIVREAKKLQGLKGWVRNLPNGDVELMVQGDEQKIQKLVILCRQGPSGSIVKNMVERDLELQKGLNDFEIVAT